jgi:hypothetical protein
LKGYGYAAISPVSRLNWLEGASGGDPHSLLDVVERVEMAGDAGFI